MGMVVVWLAVLVGLGVALLAAYEVWMARGGAVPAEIAPDADVVREALTP